MSEDKGRIHSIESFGTLDGPGIRSVVFFQGCPLRCKFCHNPDCLQLTDGLNIAADELVAKLLSNKSYWGTQGGVTLSGGEPLMQDHFALSILKKLKQENVHTAVDSCLFTSKVIIDSVKPYVDLWMVSIKQLNDSIHKDLTGVSNQKILDNIKYLDSILTTNSLRIRYLIIPTICDTQEYQKQLLEFIKQLKHLEVLEILAYGSHAKYKWMELKGEYPLEGIPDATKELVHSAAEFFETNNIPVKY